MRGITLLELLVVLALLGVLTAMSAAALGPMTRRYRISQGAEQVSQAVYLARALSRETSRCHLVEVLDAAGNVLAPGGAGSIVRVRRRATADCETAIVEPPVSPLLTEVERVRLPTGVSVKLSFLPAGPARPEVMWRPNGRLTTNTNSARFTLASTVAASTTSVVQVDPQGAICVDPSPPGACL